jgi:SAM-dependent methyltransferase
VELGCRSGGLLRHFVDGNDVVGVDIDKRSLRMCQKRFGIETHWADLNSTLPLAESDFDVVVMSEVLEHLPYPSISLGEVVRVLKPSGKFVGSVPNGTRLRNRLRFLFGGPVELDPTHLFHYSEITLTSLLQRYFENVQIVQVSSRFLKLSPGLFANYLLFSCDSPKKLVDAGKMAE